MEAARKNPMSDDLSSGRHFIRARRIRRTRLVGEFAMAGQAQCSADREGEPEHGDPVPAFARAVAEQRDPDDGRRDRLADDERGSCLRDGSALQCGGVGQ